MPDRNIKRRLQDAGDAAVAILASHDLVLKAEALRPGGCSARPSTKSSDENASAQADSPVPLRS
jgi:hypothetical protein